MRNTVHAFGDSFTQSFSDQFQGLVHWATSYRDYLKGEIPKNYVDIVAEKLDMNVNNKGVGGRSNMYIFHRFTEYIDKFKKGDVVLVNWTAVSRFSIANEFNELVDVIPGLSHPKQHEYVDKDVTETIGVNRSMYSVYWMEVLDYITTMNEICKLKEVKIVHWTWIEPSITLFDKLIKERDELKKLPLMIISKEFSNQEIINSVRNQATHLYETLVGMDYEYVRKLADNPNNTVIFDLKTPEPNEKLLSIIRPKFVDVTDHTKLFYDMLIPFRKYETISEETNKVVNDIHYGKNGHIELANDILRYL